MDGLAMPVKVHGFSLIEAVLVISMMGILATVTFIYWPGYNINIGAQARQLASDIRYTQALAMSSNQRYYLQLTPASRSYQIKNASGSPITLASGLNTVTLGMGIAFGTLSNLPNNLIAFNGAGTPFTTSASPGTALAATAAIVLTTGNVTQTISINAGTGKVDVQ